MSTLTKGWLLKTIAELEEEHDATPGVVNVDAAMALAAMKLALASLEAEAVCVIDQSNLDYLKSGSDADVWPASRTEMGDVLLYRTAPPAPVSVPDLTALDNLAGEMLNHAMNCERRVAVAYTHCAHRLAEEVRDLRTAMLQGAEPVTTAYKLGNSPVIQDGYVLVPVEPTEDMIIHGFESEPDESFSDADVWEAYESMSGCQQAAHRAKLCWAAMIAAAPKPDVR
ncbi:hypothetical protein LEH37_02520 [Salmonella enterica]|nr:hypothetical protein [Salmonella enterica]MDJ4718937.1 hypothetical protein [Salmonella enterica]MDJ4868536.1 hypothetical protein [Salmonella enterica]MDJ7607669.1 hypothetical protein [Salmonella enterica]MDJ8144017.1 hypothetical protein [Salmonella enterica]